MTAAEVLHTTDTVEVEWVSPAALKPAPDNPRSDMGDLDELAASITSVGIVQPIIATRRAGKLIIVAGHRRHAAAVIAGVDQVPVIVRDFDEVDRQEAMLVENLQRRDLSPLEEARGFAQLAELGHSQRQIADRVGCTQPHVSKRIKLLELPQDVQDAVEAKAWPIEDALHLAKLSGSPAAVLKLFKIASDPGFYGSVERLVEDAVQAARDKKRRREVRAELEKMQVRIVELDGRVAGNYLMLQPGQRPVGEQWVRGLKLDVEAHEKEPCAATALLTDGRTAPICTDAARHEANDPSPASTGDSRRSDGSNRLEPSPERLHREALEAAKVDRRAAAKAAVRPPKRATAELAWATIDVAVETLVERLWLEAFELAGGWLGLDLPKGETAAATAIVTHARTSHEAAVATVMALHAAMRELDVCSTSWNRQQEGWSPADVAYVEWLAESVGFAPSPAEQVELDKAAGARR